MNYKKNSFTVAYMLFYISLVPFFASASKTGNHKGFHLYVILCTNFCIIKLIVIKDTCFFAFNTRCYNSFLANAKYQNNIVSLDKSIRCFHNINSRHILGFYKRLNIRDFQNSLIKYSFFVLEQEVNSNITISIIKNIKFYSLDNTETFFSIYGPIITKSPIMFFNILYIKFTDQNKFSINHNLFPELTLFINKPEYREKYNRYEKLKILYSTMLINEYLKKTSADTKINTGETVSITSTTYKGNFYEQ
ncbi:hypothetical protein K6025_00925 [Ehrlichia sp. JZT12]